MYICPNANRCRYAKERKVEIGLDDGADIHFTLPVCSHSKRHVRNHYCGSTCPSCVECTPQVGVIPEGLLLVPATMVLQ